MLLLHMYSAISLRAKSLGTERGKWESHLTITCKDLLQILALILGTYTLSKRECALGGFH